MKSKTLQLRDDQRRLGYASDDFSWRSIVTVLGLVVMTMGISSCFQSLTRPQLADISPEAFMQEVTQSIYEGFTYSEAEVYLTKLGQLSSAEVFQYGSEVCTQLHQGKDLKTLDQMIRAEMPLEDDYMTHLQIARAAEKVLCPKS